MDESVNRPRTVFVSGNFNILHPGHLRLLRFARELGDRLIVAVHSDRLGSSAVHVPEYMRLEGLRCNSWVSEAFLIDEPIPQVLARLRPDIVVKGKEHESAHNPELEVIEQYGGRLVFSSGDVVFSSLDLIRKSLLDNECQWLRFPEDYAQRHRFTRDDLAMIVRRFSGLRVCVIGDLIVDEYITCDPLGMSQEDPTIVVTPVDTQRFVGGAGIVAAHTAGLGAHVDFISVAGNDTIRDYAQQALADYGVIAHLWPDASRPTTLKQRFRAQGKTLLRVSHLHQGSINAMLQRQILEYLEDQLDGYDLLIFSDFNYGCLPQSIVDRLILRGREEGLILVADSQCSSQIGDVSRFKGMHLLTPTEREARVSLRNHDDGLVVIAERLRQEAQARNIILTLGAEGALLYIEGKEGSFETDRLPALNSNPKDVAGAGDAMLAATALTLAADGNAWQAACLGSLAAGIQASRLGNCPLDQAHFLSQW